jgi:hypothetical protein
MPNFLMLNESNLFPIPENKRFKGSRAPKIDVEAQMRQQEDLMNRQMALQQQYQVEAEARFRAEEERQRQQEYIRRVQAADVKEKERITQERQEASTFREMTGQTKEESSDFGGGFNLDMPTIERPGYEQEDRPL